MAHYVATFRLAQHQKQPPRKRVEMKSEKKIWTKRSERAEGGSADAEDRVAEHESDAEMMLCTIDVVTQRA